MNNYPPGAANDPNAPYNQSDPPEVDVTVTEKLVKETCIRSYGGHYEADWEYDAAEGRNVCSQYWDPGNTEEDFREQCRTAEQCLADCARVLKGLVAAGISFIDHVDIRNLYNDCLDWEQEEFEIEEA